MPSGTAGVDLLDTAARAACRRGLFVVSVYLQKASAAHLRHGCPSAPGRCAAEIEAARLLTTGF